MTRVALDATPLLGARTGIGVFTAGAMTALARRRAVDLVAYAATWRRRGELPAVLPPGVTAVQAPMPAGALHALWRRTDHPVAERWTGRVDVVHGTNFVVPPTRWAAEVVSVHDLTCLRYPELCAPSSLRFPDLIRRALRRGAFVHTHAGAIAEEVVEAFAVDPERVRAVPPGVDDVAVSGTGADGPPAAERLRAAGGRPYVLALGQVEPRKDLPGLVAAFDEAAERRPEVELVIAGPPGWGDAQLDAAVAAARHGDRVRRTGWVPDHQRRALLAGATVLAYPSIYEGFGLPPLEAMAAGVPVVATEAGAIPSVVGDAARLVPVGDRAALATAIGELLDDPDARRRLVEAGRHRVAQFTWDRCAEGLEGLYADAATDAGARDGSRRLR